MKRFLRRHLLTLLLALMGCDHRNCGENEAAAYARFLDPNVHCWFDVEGRGQSRETDIAICQIIVKTSDREGPETWLCTANPDTCRVVGPVIVVERKR